MDILPVVSRHCDVTKLRRACNARGCERQPGKEILLYELDRISSKTRDLMCLYLCHDHFAESERTFMKELECMKHKSRVLKISTKDMEIIVPKEFLRKSK